MSNVLIDPAPTRGGDADLIDGAVLKAVQPDRHESEQATPVSDDDLIDILPGPAAEIAVLHRDLSRWPVAFTVASMIAAVAAAIGGLMRVKVRDWAPLVASIHLLIIARSGAKKSHPEEFATRALRDLDLRLRQEHKMLSAGAEPGVPLPPVPRRVTLGGTVEGRVKLAGENPRGLLCIMDEMSAWTRGHGQYKGGRGSDQEVDIHQMDGNSVGVDLKGGGSTHAVQPAVSYMGTSQTSKAKYFRDEGSGLVARLSVVVGENVEFEELPEEYPDPAITDRWHEWIRTIAETAMPQGEFDRPDAYIVRLSDEAVQVFHQYDRYKVARQREFADHPTRPSILDKLQTNLAKYALSLEVLHRVVAGEGVVVDEISGESMRRAVVLARFFEGHALRFDELLNGSPRERLDPKRRAALDVLPDEARYSEIVEAYEAAGLSKGTAKGDLRKGQLWRKSGDRYLKLV